MIFGQVNKQAKIELWRMERFVLPVITDESRDIRSEVRELLDKVTKWDSALNKACSFYATQLIRRNGSRTPDKKEKQSVVSHMPCSSVYWSNLEQSFRQLLEKGLNDNPEKLQADWLDEIRRAIQSAWRKQEEVIIGGDVWSIRAMVLAGGIIARIVKELNDSKDAASLSVSSVTT
jgi:hypothetical protein